MSNFIIEKFHMILSIYKKKFSNKKKKTAKNKIDSFSAILQNFYVNKS